MVSVVRTSAGKDLVLWRDGGGQWRCFADKCAHRNAPLSEGRIEPQNGSIMCSYHGATLQHKPTGTAHDEGMTSSGSQTDSQWRCTRVHSRGLLLVVGLVSAFVGRC